MVRIHGPGDDEELKRQKRLLRFGGKGSNALPLGNLRVSRASKADSAVALTPPNGRRVSLVSAKPEAQSQSFDFGRGDPLPPPSTRTVDATVQGSSSVRTRLYYDEELAHSSTLLHGQQPPQEAPRGRLGKQFTRSQVSVAQLP